MGGLGDAIEERGIQRGIQEGIEKGIRILILDNLEEGISKERILIKLKEKFQLTQEQAEERLKNMEREEDRPAPLGRFRFDAPLFAVGCLIRICQSEGQESYCERA